MNKMVFNIDTKDYMQRALIKKEICLESSMISDVYMLMDLENIEAYYNRLESILFNYKLLFKSTFDKLRYTDELLKYFSELHNKEVIYIKYELFKRFVDEIRVKTIDIETSIIPFLYSLCA